MSLQKLTALSTQTLSLLLERQRLPAADLHRAQIARNLKQLRTGILEMEAGGEGGEAARLMRAQYGRMCGMVPNQMQEEMGIESLHEPDTESSMPSPPSPPLKENPDPVYTPYTDDPEAQYEPGEMLQTQRHLMDEQDTHLDRLSHSIGRQRDLSLQINDELDVHTGLLEELDTDLDHTHGRLSGARRRLEKVAKGVKGNGSTVTIALLILVLLILIIVFKT